MAVVRLAGDRLIGADRFPVTQSGALLEAELSGLRRGQAEQSELLQRVVRAVTTRRPFDSAAEERRSDDERPLGHREAQEFFELLKKLPSGMKVERWRFAHRDHVVVEAHHLSPEEAETLKTDLVARGWVVDFVDTLLAR